MHSLTYLKMYFSYFPFQFYFLFFLFEEWNVNLLKTDIDSFLFSELFRELILTYFRSDEIG